jgi:hypothetical protein
MLRLWNGVEGNRGMCKALMEKYRPYDGLPVSEFKKRLNDVSLKGNQDPLGKFEGLSAIEHAHLETKATLGSRDLIGAVFAAAPDKYHSVLNITAKIKCTNKLHRHRLPLIMV